MVCGEHEACPEPDVVVLAGGELHHRHAAAVPAFADELEAVQRAMAVPADFSNAFVDLPEHFAPDRSAVAASIPPSFMSVEGIGHRLLTCDAMDDKKDTTVMSYMSTSEPVKPWRFVTNHTQVLLCIARDPDVRMKAIAGSVGITERAAQRIVRDLIESGFVQRERVGRRNRYVINRELRMRHQAQHEHEIGELLDLLKLEAV